MSPASLVVAARPHPEPARIAALSATIALNLAAMLVLCRPMPPLRALLHPLATVPQVTLIEAPPPPPPPPAIHLKPLPLTPVAPVRAPPQPSPAPPQAAPNDVGNQAMPTPAPTSPPQAIAAAPAQASLAYRTAPLQYPPLALRQHLEGTVLLRVLVDETGKPLQAEIEQGSGHALLDRSARQQVLAHWRFQPAMVDGRAVRAWARVPVRFALNTL